MDALRFMKMDFLKMKTQGKLMALVVIIVVFLAGKMMGNMMGIWGTMYMIFMGIILCATPFGIDVMVADGFVKLLPAQARQRVFGRFLFAAVFLTACAVCGSLTALPYIMKGEIAVSYILPKVILFFSVGLCINSVQYVFSYFFEIKNQQWLSIIRLVPGFVFFFGGSFFMDIIGERQGEVMSKIGMMLNYALEHQGLVAIVFLFIAVIFTMVCACICGKREDRKEA